MLVQIMAWCRPGDKPLSEPMMIILLTHIYVTRPPWVNSALAKLPLNVNFGLTSFIKWPRRNLLYWSSNISYFHAPAIETIGNIDYVWWSTLKTMSLRPDQVQVSFQNTSKHTVKIWIKRACTVYANCITIWFTISTCQAFLLWRFHANSFVVLWFSLILHWWQDGLRLTHDDVIKWKHFLRYWPFVRGIHQSPVNFPPQRPVTRSFDVFFDQRLNKRLSKQWWGWWFETPAHYDVIIMSFSHVAKFGRKLILF